MSSWYAFHKKSYPQEVSQNLLFISHGSPHPDFERAFREFLDSLVDALPQNQILGSTLSGSGPSPEFVLQKVGPKDPWLAVPLLLSAASHSTEIQQRLQPFMKSHQIKVIRPMENNPGLEDLWLRLARSALENIPSAERNPKKTHLLAVTHDGESPAESLPETWRQRISTGLELSCSLARYSPKHLKLEKSLDELPWPALRHLILLPLILFPGASLEKMKWRTDQHLAARVPRQDILCHWAAPLGPGPELTRLCVNSLWANLESI